MKSGDLTERVTLSRRIETNPDAPNDYGNTVSDWVEQGTVWAQYIHLRGGEAVIAGRLTGRHPQIIRIRASALTRQVAADWKVTDARTGVDYAIRDVTLDPGRAVVDLLCERGVAVG